MADDAPSPGVLRGAATPAWWRCSSALVLAAVMAAGYLLQALVQHGSLTSANGPALKEQREVDKLTAEVKQIRSDTGGSLYWLKLAAVFVTVGAGVGGYLIAHSRSTRERLAAEDRRTDLRLAFERRGQVDAAYQAMVLEPSSSSAILRANAAMKLGKVLQSPPVEWHLEDDRRDEIWSLTKQLLAASLAIETEPKVLKALTIAVALHASPDERGDLRGLDFSLAKAADAYWARVDFSYADFYKADLNGGLAAQSHAGRRAVPRDPPAWSGPGRGDVPQDELQADRPAQRRPVGRRPHRRELRERQGPRRRARRRDGRIALARPRGRPVGGGDGSELRSVGEWISRSG